MAHRWLVDWKCAPFTGCIRSKIKHLVAHHAELPISAVYVSNLYLEKWQCSASDTFIESQYFSIGKDKFPRPVAYDKWG